MMKYVIFGLVVSVAIGIVLAWILIPNEIDNYIEDGADIDNWTYHKKPKKNG